MLLRNTNDLIKYDFLTINKFEDNVSDSHYVKKIRIQKNKIIKSILYTLFGEFNSNKIIYDFKKWTLNKKKWNRYKKDLKEADTLIIGGGNMIMDLSSTWPSLFHDYIKLAEKLNKKIRVVFVGVGPLKFQENRKIISNSLKHVDFISVRDSRSKKLLKNVSSSLVVKETVDPVFLMKFISKEERIKINVKSIKSNRISIGICILSRVCFNSKEEYQDYKKGIKNLIKELYTLNNSIHFILFSTEKMDYFDVEDVYSSLYKHENLSIEKFEVIILDDLRKLYLKINFLIGGRMHSLILGQKFLLPHIGFIWQDKLHSFARITNSEVQMYKLSTLSKSFGEIAKNILLIQDDLNLINKMDLKNKELEKLVDKGL